MILSDREIQSVLKAGLILIEPLPDPSFYSLTSLDLTLHGALLSWNDPSAPPAGHPKKVRPMDSGFDIRAFMDDPKSATRHLIGPDGFDLEPRMFVLGYTQQRIYLPNSSRLAARVEGKSSLARLGVGIHVTAPTIHAGFGFNPKAPNHLGLQIQLEIFNVGNQVVVLDVDMPICQLILEEVREVPTRGYQGRFSDQQSFSAMC